MIDRLEMFKEGGEMAREVFGCFIGEQLHCSACGCNTHESAYCQYLYNVSASGLRLQALALQNSGTVPAVVSTPHPSAERLHTLFCQDGLTAVDSVLPKPCMQVTSLEGPVKSELGHTLAGISDAVRLVEGSENALRQEARQDCLMCNYVAMYRAQCCGSWRSRRR